VHTIQLAAILMFALVFAVGAAAADQPYAGQQTRGIKTLSDHEIADYLQGTAWVYPRSRSSTITPGQDMYWIKPTTSGSLLRNSPRPGRSGKRWT